MYATYRREYENYSSPRWVHQCLVSEVYGGDKQHERQCGRVPIWWSW
jgi:hypothetical protein